MVLQKQPFTSTEDSTDLLGHWLLDGLSLLAAGAMAVNILNNQSKQ
jgi:hypothetical protein